MHHGWVIIDKGKNISSARVVSTIKRLTSSKCGHAGTLDPLATGVLPIAIGEATKLCGYMLATDKHYEFEVTWGEERSTDDAEGEIVARVESLEFSEADLLNAMEEFKGKIEQMPPQYSALKLNGKKAYELAREGTKADLKPREIEIYDFVMLKHSARHTQFSVHCSKGTYIRSIARDMGRKLGCYGYVSELRRVTHGNFSINNAITLEKFEEMCKKGAEQSVILPPDEVLDDILELKVSD
ncbi:MAG: tRNA pseudouridine(55) synthase TruB, partial [Alphaproteobacteria bacterium CG11_big_fil_rev_8_21_14_0_20_44_7]